MAFLGLISQRQGPLGPTLPLSSTPAQSQAKQLHNTALGNGWLPLDMFTCPSGIRFPGRGLGRGHMVGGVGRGAV